MAREWKQQGEDKKEGGYGDRYQAKGWEKNWKGSRGWNNKKGGDRENEWKDNDKGWRDNRKSWKDNKSNWNEGNRRSDWKSSSAEESNSKSWEATETGDGSGDKPQEDTKWSSSDGAWEADRNGQWKEGQQGGADSWKGGNTWGDSGNGDQWKSATNWEDTKKDGASDDQKEDPWKQGSGHEADDHQPQSEEYADGDDDEDAVADMEYSDDWSKTYVWVRCATVGQLEFTIGDLPEFDSSIDTSSLWTFTVYLNRVPGSKPLTIPVVSGDMERLVFAPRLDAKDDQETWGHVTNNGALEPVKMCMGKDKNGVLVLEYPRAENEYQDPDPTALSSPKEFWTEVDEIPTRKLCVTQGDRVLYFDSWSQLDTPYISATYATKQDRGPVLLGDSKDRSWEGFSVGVKLRNSDNSNHTSDWGVKGETEETNENCEEKEKEEEQLHQTRWFSVSLNRGKLNIWAPDGPMKDTDEKILVFQHSRKESSWIIPEAWLRTGVPDTDVDEALKSKQPLKSMNGYVYAQQFYGTVQSLHKSHSATGDEDGDGDDVAPAVTPPEISEKPPIQEQMMNMSKSFWHEREGREGRLQQLREKCQVMKDYNDNLASQLEEAEGLYKDLSEKVEQMKAKIGCTVSN